MKEIRMLRNVFLAATMLFVFLNMKAQFQLNHVDPPMWWIGMYNRELLLTLHGNDIARLNPMINHEGVTIKTVTRTENSNYLFMTLDISETTKPGPINIQFFNEKKKRVLAYDYLLSERKAFSEDRPGFGPQDVIYLLMPDRFANGDKSNDSVEQLAEKVNRSDQDGRHGGDIQGIIDHLDYLKDLGVTALWTTPVLEDNLPTYSYHTYATTNYFKIDGRYGTNEDYARLADECHKRGIKLIMDMVPNHCGSDHWWMKDLPMKDWVHEFPQFTRTNYTIATWNDPHAAWSDLALNVDGWFDVTMPDLNQNNPLLLAYLKQFAIFWVEYAGLDGIRVDTYPYADKWRIADWTRAIRDEYPALNIVGECWQHRPSEIAYWQSGVNNFDRYDSFLPSVMDFPLNDAFMSWEMGASRFYNVYVMDYLYADPLNILIFLDNHDTQRFSEQIKFDPEKFRLSVAHLLTTRGIPQIYTGTEIMMGGKKRSGDGDIRRDFPGGWPEDVRNAFEESGRTDGENEAFNFMKTLLNYRKNNPVLHDGRMVQFIPRDDIYVYFRMDDVKKVMVALNHSDSKKSLDVSRFNECLNGASTGRNIITGEDIQLIGLTLDAEEALILEILE